MARRALVVVTAGLSQPSSTRLLADRIASTTERFLRDARLEARTELIELREHALDLANHSLTGFPSPRLRSAIGSVVAADALIAVTPIFNASYSGLFKLFFDVLERDSLERMPVAIAATGGTARHSLALEHALRPLFAYLGAAVVPTAVYAATADWGQGGDGVDRGLADRIDRVARELADAMSGQRRQAPVDPFEEPVPFEQLLRSGRSDGDEGRASG